MFDVDVQEGAPPLKLPYNASGMVSFGALAVTVLRDVDPSLSRKPVHRGTALPAEQ